MTFEPEQPPRRPVTMGRLTAIVGGAIALIVVIVLVLVFALRGGTSGPAPTQSLDGGSPQTNPSQISSPEPLNTTKPSSTVAPSAAPSLKPVGSKFTPAQLVGAETAAAQGYLQYCAYQPKESTAHHLSRMTPYFVKGSSFTKAAALAKNIDTASCNTLQNQIAGVDSKGRLVVSLIVKTTAQLKDKAGTQKRTVTAYVTTTQQAKIWRVAGIQQSSVASK